MLVIAATNKDLSKEIDKGNFRMDLYHRLSVIIMHVPTLNERRDDIPILAEQFVQEICDEYGLPKKIITPKAMEELMAINWTGNIRELHNVMERLVILSDAKITEQEVLAYGVANVTKDPLEMLFNRFEKFVDFRETWKRNISNSSFVSTTGMFQKLPMKSICSAAISIARWRSMD